MVEWKERRVGDLEGITKHEVPIEEKIKEETAKQARIEEFGVRHYIPKNGKVKYEPTKIRSGKPRRLKLDEQFDYIVSKINDKEIQNEYGTFLTQEKKKLAKMWRLFKTLPGEFVDFTAIPDEINKSKAGKQRYLKMLQQAELIKSYPTALGDIVYAKNTELKTDEDIAYILILNNKQIKGWGMKGEDKIMSEEEKKPQSITKEIADDLRTYDEVKQNFDVFDEMRKAWEESKNQRIGISLKDFIRMYAILKL
ncbi:MAG: hypothetical protein RBR32_07790 [Bacteroidales bacterium]|nr:hypothetical protein [Bacteroidales bacterium]